MNTTDQTTTRQQKLSKTQLNESRIGLGHFLSGYARHSLTDLENLQTFTGWQDAAQKILERRRVRLLEALDTPTLTAIANGQIDLGQTISLMYHSLKRDEDKRSQQ